MMKHFAAWFLGMALTTSLVGGAAQAGASGGFADIAGHWANPTIVQAVAEGWVNGYPDGSFRPDASVTRAEFVKLLLGMQGLTPDSPLAGELIKVAAVDVAGEAPLTDMNSHWLQQQGWLPVALAEGLVVSSDWGGSFSGDTPITRLQVAVMGDRAIGRGAVAEQNKEIGATLPFSDGQSLPTWAQSYVQEAVAAGMVHGYPDNTFRPSAPITRAEAVTIAARIRQSMQGGFDHNLKVTLVAPGQWYPTFIPWTRELPIPVKLVNGEPMVSANQICNALVSRPPQLQDWISWQDGCKWVWHPLTERLTLSFGAESQEYTAGIAQINLRYKGGAGDTVPINWTVVTPPVAPVLVNSELYVHYDAFFHAYYNDGTSGEKVWTAGSDYERSTEQITITFPVPNPPYTGE